jgi:hypothetical protein
MTSIRKWVTRCRFGVVALTIALGLATGCGGQADPALPLRDFAIDFARSALAAFLL